MIRCGPARGRPAAGDPLGAGRGRYRVPAVAPGTSPKERAAAVLPSLQDPELIGRMAPVIIQGCDATFCENVHAARARLRVQNGGRVNKQPMAALLAGFFRYYAREWPALLRGAVSPRLGRRRFHRS